MTMPSDSLEELVQFLAPESRIDVKTVALNHVLGLTGNEDGAKAIAHNKEMLVCLVRLLEDANPSVAKDSALAVINLSAAASGAGRAALLALDGAHDGAVATLWRRVEDKDSFVADPACMALSNLCAGGRSSCDAVAAALTAAGVELDKIVFVFCQRG